MKFSNVFSIFCGLFLTTIVAAGSSTTADINQGSGVDTTGDGNNDIFIQGGGGNPPTFMVSANSAEKKGYFGGTSFASLTCDEAINASGTYNTFNFLPEPGEIFFVRDSDQNRYSKVRFNSVNPGVSINLTYESLGSCNAGPVPVSSFTYSSYDLVTFFTDTSTENPNAWSWDFDGQGSSGSQNPIFTFSSGNTYSVSLMASNTAGDGNNTNQSVTVSERSSTTDSIGFDLDNDTNNDLVILNAPSGCSNNNAALQTSSGATYASLGMDYRNVDENDIPPSIISSGAFCSEEGSTALFNSFMLKTSDGAIYKFWTPQVGSTDARMEFELLSDAPVPTPVSSFTHSTYDRIAFFTDTSSETPGSWDWDFGDSSGTSSFQNPSYYYSANNTYSVELVASNNGGAGTTAQDNVTVSARPSTIINVGLGIDFDNDKVEDLSIVSPNGCSGNVTLRPAGGATWSSDSIDYRNANSVPANINSTSDFCSSEGVAGLFDIRYIKTSTNSVVKFWTPDVSSSQLRMEYELLAESTEPNAPTNLSAVIDNMSAAISFTGSSDDGGSPILDYDADCGAGSSTPVANDTQAIIVTGLTNGVTYQCSVSARNAVGVGTASTAINVIPDFVIFRDGFETGTFMTMDAKALVNWIRHQQVNDDLNHILFNPEFNAFQFNEFFFRDFSADEQQVLYWFESMMKKNSPESDWDGDGINNENDWDVFGLFE